MNVKGIFKTLGIAVACVIVIAFALNFLIPSVMSGLIDGSERMIYNATGMKFDFNGNGSDPAGTDVIRPNQGDDAEGAGVEGVK